MTKALRSFVLPTLLAAMPAVAAPPGDTAHGAPVRAIAEVMNEQPMVEIDRVLRAWSLERSENFGVVLIEVLGTIPLHMHPDGNRRMFLLEGRLRMLGGDHEMDMQPGDYMYLSRSHHHKVWLAPDSEHALLLLVDNPPTSARNIVWLETTPSIRWNPDQAKSALSIGER